jgi:hypothetical protein
MKAKKGDFVLGFYLIPQSKNIGASTSPMNSLM